MQARSTLTQIVVHMKVDSDTKSIEQAKGVFDQFLQKAADDYEKFKAQPLLNEHENLAAIEESYQAFVAILKELRALIESNDIPGYVALPAQQHQDQMAEIIDQYLELLNNDSKNSLDSANFYNQVAWFMFFAVTFIILAVSGLAHFG